MTGKLKNLMIVRSFRCLTGNTRTSVIFEPMWGIPHVLFSFYLSLYLKAQGVTDQQIGYLIAIGFVSGTVFSMFSGAITDYLGRKKTTIIFDLIAWPLAVALYAVANSFWLFALAAVFNSVMRVTAVSFNLMLVEDADEQQRKAAFTLINMINIFSGLFTPLAGLLVKNLGIITAERILMIFAVVSMFTMMLLRNHRYVETRMGKEILKERQAKRTGFGVGVFTGTIRSLSKKPSISLIMSVLVLFNLYLPLGTLNSLYFAPYLTEQLKLDQSLISLLGGVNSLTIFAVLICFLPRIQQGIFPLLIGLLLQMVSLLVLILIPPGYFGVVVVAVILYALGFGLFRPLIDALFAEVTEGKDRAGLYGLNNTLIAVFGAITGFFSGRLYHQAPVAVFYFSFFILLVCTGGLIFYAYVEKKTLRPRVKFNLTEKGFR